MKVILHRGGNYVSGGNSRRFEPSPDPQEVPAPFGEAMIARGSAERPPAPPKAASAGRQSSSRANASDTNGEPADSGTDGDDD